MGSSTGIEWTDASWSPIRARNLATGKIGWHCEHKSPGCEFCYAETLNLRFGTGLPFKPGHRKDIDIFLDEKMLTVPLRWKKPRRIFVCSMTDLFADFVPDELIDRVFGIMALCPQHCFQVLTKRSRRMREYVGSRPQAIWHRRALEIEPSALWRLTASGWPLLNVHLGVSAEDQERWDERYPDLFKTPAARRFVSLEPLIGRIDMCEALGMWWNQTMNSWESTGEHINRDNCGGRKLDWAIVGGESGPGHRPMRMEWAESLQVQCRAAGVAYFFKQDSGPRSGMRGRAIDELWSAKEFPQ